MEFLETVIARANYWAYVILLLIGLYAMFAKNNLVKKLIGMSIFQTAIILFWVSIAAKNQATIPILEHGETHTEHEEHGTPVTAEEVDHSYAIAADAYVNPLPHVLMLTAIVVGVSTFGVGLAITQRVFQTYGSLEESEILEKIRNEHG